MPRNPCPKEELYCVGDDRHQLNNQAADPANAETLKRMRQALDQWTTETGDTIPARPTPHRDAPPGAPPKSRKNFRRGEMPGAASGAQKINHPGPIRLGE